MKPVPRSPNEVSLILTRKCNLRCKHCSIYGDGPIEGDLSTDQWCRIITELSGWKVLRLTISGGEPLVREDFPLILSHILTRPLRFSLNTNAMLITDEIARLLADAAPRLDSVMVSVDGAGPQSHDVQRGPGAFEGMARGVAKLRERAVPFGFYCTVTSLNADEVEQIASWGIAQGARYVKFNDLLEIGMACTNKSLALTRKKRREVGRRVTAMADKNPRITGTTVDMYRYIERVLAGTAPKYPQGSRGCGAMRNKMTVWPDGRVSPCDRLAHETIGNVLEGSLEKIWSGERARKFREMLAVPLSEVETCRDCEYLDVCTGGCPVLPMYGEPESAVLGCDPLSCVRVYLGQEQEAPARG